MVEPCRISCGRSILHNGTTGLRNYVHCGDRMPIPWCYPACPPRMSPSSSPFCGPKVYTSPRPGPRSCRAYSISHPRSSPVSTMRYPKDLACIPPPLRCPSSYPYGACSALPTTCARHTSYCAGCGSVRCSNGCSYCRRNYACAE